VLPKVWKTCAPSKVARSFLGNFCKIGYRLVKISSNEASLGMIMLLCVCFVD
jgi:hypothetical protein